MKEFNRDMEKYLSKRRELNLDLFKPKRETNKWEKKESWWQSLFKNNSKSKLTPIEKAQLRQVEDEIVMIDNMEEYANEEEVEVLEQERESLMQKFFGLFRLFERKHDLEEKAEQINYVEEQVIPSIDADVKQVLKIAHKWLEKLPMKEKRNFRESDDFKQYKAILERYEVAKSK